MLEPESHLNLATLLSAYYDGRLIFAVIAWLKMP